MIHFCLYSGSPDHCFLYQGYLDVMLFYLLQDDVNEKISCAFCPPKVAASNPCLEYIKSVVLPWFGKFEVVQKEGDNSNNK